MVLVFLTCDHHHLLCKYRLHLDLRQDLCLDDVYDKNGDVSYGDGDDGVYGGGGSDVRYP